MRIEDLRYSLVAKNVVGTPREFRLGRRDLGRMLVIDRATGSLADHIVHDLPTVLAPGDVVVLNNSKRIPGVLHGRSPLGGKVELRFVDLDDNGGGLCRIFPMHDVNAGTVIPLREGGDIRVLDMGRTKYELAYVKPVAGNLKSYLRSQGTPILGFFYEGMWSTENLNPFYASEEGSVESPLAGLHFTRELVTALSNRGVHVCFITLHSVGSWLPFLEESAEDHKMWPEIYEVGEETVRIVSAAKNNGHRVIACGSTSLRALEAAATKSGTLRQVRGRTKLYIQPGYQFKVVDGYFTNFHQQQTSLMILDCAIGGQQNVMRAYREASRRGYEFYEFGDAVLYL